MRIRIVRCVEQMNAAIETVLVRRQRAGIPTRQSLLERLRDWKDERSWREFYNTYWKLIYQVSLRAGLTQTEAEDVLQETIISVCKHMPNFRYDAQKGSFKNWLLRLTKWRIIDQLRKRKHGAFECQGLEAVELSTIDALDSPADAVLDSLWDQEWKRNLMDAAVRRVRAHANPRQYQIFDLHVLKRWPVRRVCKELNVNAGQVYLAKHRITKLIKQQVKALETSPVTP